MKHSVDELKMKRDGTLWYDPKAAAARERAETDGPRRFRVEFDADVHGRVCTFITVEAANEREAMQLVEAGRGEIGAEIGIAVSDALLLLDNVEIVGIDDIRAEPVREAMA